MAVYYTAATSTEDETVVFLPDKRNAEIQIIMYQNVCVYYLDFVQLT